MLIATSFSVFTSFGQNLVPNPGFEFFKNCPGGLSESPHEFTVTGWHPGGMGSPDHFHVCSEGEGDVPHNWAGISDAFEGTGYAGIFLWMNDPHDYREYLQCKLIEPLIKDSLYNVSFRYKLSSYSKYAIDRIGLLLSDVVLTARHDNVIKVEPTFSVIRDSALTETTGLWELASTQYKARGGESFLTIGNFFDNGETHSYEIKFRPVQQAMLANSAYYYVDNVRVIPQYIANQEMLTDVLPAFALEQTELNKTYVLKNIQFELNSYKLVPPSFEELAQVAEYLVQHPKAKVQFFGHTDDQGTDGYNLKLSTNRAKSAAGYLTTLGINPNRIEVFGYGEAKPIVKDSSDESRAINRRVEIRFIK